MSSLVMSVNGMPLNTPCLGELIESLKTALHDGKEFDVLTKNMVRIAFGPDPNLPTNSGRIITVTVFNDLRPLPIPLQLHQQMSETISDVMHNFVKKHVPGCQKILVSAHDGNHIVCGAANSHVIDFDQNVTHGY